MKEIFKFYMGANDENTQILWGFGLGVLNGAQNILAIILTEKLVSQKVDFETKISTLEGKLRKFESNFHALLDNLPYGILFGDQKKGVVYTNKFWEENQNRFNFNAKHQEERGIEAEPEFANDNEGQEENWKAYEMLKKFK